MVGQLIDSCTHRIGQKAQGTAHAEDNAEDYTGWSEGFPAALTPSPKGTGPESSQDRGSRL